MNLIDLEFETAVSFIRFVVVMVVKFFFGSKVVNSSQLPYEIVENLTLIKAVKLLTHFCGYLILMAIAQHCK